MLGVFAEFERAMIRERVLADMDRAKRHGTKSGRPIGRPEVSADKVGEIRRLRAHGMGTIRTAETVGVGVSVVQRLEAYTQLVSCHDFVRNGCAIRLHVDRPTAAGSFHRVVRYANSIHRVGGLFCG